MLVTFLARIEPALSIGCKHQWLVAIVAKVHMFFLHGTYIHVMYMYMYVHTCTHVALTLSSRHSFSLLSAFLELMLEVDRGDELRNAAVTRFDLSRLYSTSEVYC